LLSTLACSPETIRETSSVRAIPSFDWARSGLSAAALAAALLSAGGQGAFARDGM